MLWLRRSLMPAYNTRKCVRATASTGTWTCGRRRARTRCVAWQACFVRLALPIGYVVVFCTMTSEDTSAVEDIVRAQAECVSPPVRGCVSRLRSRCATHKVSLSRGS